MCSGNFMTSNFNKIGVISFTRKTNVLNYQYRLLRTLIMRKDFDILIVKLVFNIILMFFFTYFILSITDGLLMLCFALFRSKLEYGSVAWNSVPISDSNIYERTQRKSVTLCHNKFVSRCGISL
jgi:hypothetical protein